MKNKPLEDQHERQAPVTEAPTVLSTEPGTVPHDTRISHLVNSVPVWITALATLLSSVAVIITAVRS